MLPIRQMPAIQPNIASSFRRRKALKRATASLVSLKPIQASARSGPRLRARPSHSPSNTHHNDDDEPDKDIDGIGGRPTYLVHHVFLPPQVPDENDLNLVHEAALVGATLNGLFEFRDIFQPAA
ncbi:hypothetical protein B0J13DRAFT_527690 [Dactylonectria estremocensis]|uniref:Uncharacterized protein n=1 Tax=Dactylonectria estremocensis TaxID=1079267 RepID=A0A9P9ELJ3_9HYPO|nr:hypothetical protein B0J13DRAFT_527690 [Dactylonectria estremocensis]